MIKISDNYEEYTEYLDLCISSSPVIKALILLDKNSNVLVSVIKKKEITKLDTISISAVVANLSGQKLIDQFLLGEVDQFYMRTQHGYLLLFQVDIQRILLTYIDTRDVRLGLIFLDLGRTVDKIRDIPYTMPKRKVSLEKRLQEIEDEFKENYRIFFSYAKKDTEYFQISNIAKYLEKNNPNVEIMYFEKSKIAGEDILDYMERGVNWCNMFVWFHSMNSLESKAVIKEYKMAVYLGKNVISITEDFNALPLSARVTWAILYDPNVQELCQKLMNDIKEYDLRKAKFEWKE